MTSPDRPLSARARQTRAKLLEAARDSFARKGFGQTTVGDIASAAGRGHGTFYLHFASKRAVFAALIDESVNQMTHQSRELWEPGDFAGSIRAGIAKFLEDFRQERDMWAVLDQLAVVDDEFAKVRMQWRDLLTVRVRSGLRRHTRDDADPESLECDARFLAAMLDEAGRSTFVEGRDRDVDALVDQITHAWLTLAGARPDEAR